MAELHCQCCLDSLEPELNGNADENTGEMDTISPVLAMTCVSPHCEMSLCAVCSERLLEISVRDREIAACGCKEPFLLSQITKTIPNHQKSYLSTLVFQLQTKNENELHTYLLRRQVIQKLKDEKLKHMKTMIVGALQLTIEYAFPARLKLIHRDKIVEAMNGKDGQGKRRRCPNSLCAGSLSQSNGIMQCNCCNVSYCPKCEKSLRSDDKHVCLEDDLKSMRAVSDCVQCPTCLIPVIKSFGCNFITCAICKTNFDYITGQITKAGNHDPLQITLKKENSRLTEIVDELLPNKTLKAEQKLILDDIERCRPKIYPFDKILSRLRKHVIDETSVGRAYERYKRSQYATRHYFQFIENVSNHIVKHKTYAILNRNSVNELKSDLESCLAI